MTNKKESAYLFLKRGSEEHMRNLIENGEVYLNTLQKMRSLDKEDFRYDKWEGVGRKTNYENAKLTLYNSANIIGQSNTEFNFKDVDITQMSDFAEGNIFCLAGVFSDQLVLNQPNLGIDIKEFGESLVVVTNPRAFMERLFKKLDKNNTNYSYGRVKYYDEKNDFEGKTPFDKRMRYSPQSEFRIYVESLEHTEPIKIYLGDLRDIAVKKDIPIQMKLSLTNEQEIIFQP